jgi:hypothetical protein
VNTENKKKHYAMRTKKKLGQFYSNGKVQLTKNETQFDSVFRRKRS